MGVPLPLNHENETETSHTTPTIECEISGACGIMTSSVKDFLEKVYNVTLRYQPLLKRVPISFNPSSYYTCTGERRKDDYSSDTTEFHKVQVNGPLLIRLCVCVGGGGGKGTGNGPHAHHKRTFS